jgi:hemerythrin-like domain-containing protein
MLEDLDHGVGANLRQEQPMDFKELRNTDPLKRSAEKQSETPEHSPMNPPDAYAPPSIEKVPYEAMPKFLQELMDDHKNFLTALEAFENVLNRLHENGLTPDKDVDEKLRNFFEFLDNEIVTHDLKEEKILFPPLHRRLIEKGEHSQGKLPTTAVDMLEDDHTKLMQIAAVTFNFLGLAARLPDARSRAIVLDAALEQGKALIELLRLHMFREDNVVFALAAKHLSAREFEEMGS